MNTESLEWHNEQNFMIKYEKNYIQIIRRIVKNRQIPWKNVVFVKDCHRDEIWRHDIYKEYKAAPKVTRQRMYLETIEQVYGPAEKIILDSQAGNGIVPYLPLDQLQKSKGAK